MKTLIVACCVITGCVDEQNVGNTSQILSSTRWAITIGGIDYDEARSVAVDPAGDVIASGQFKGTVDFGLETLSAPNGAGWVSKRSGVDGSELWSISLGAEPTAQADVADVATADDGSVFVVGVFAGDMTLDQQVLHGPALTVSNDCFVAKYNSTGQLQWAQTINPTGSGAFSGNCAIAAGHDGQLAVVGAYGGTIEFPNGTFTAIDHDPFVVVFDASGQMQWGVTALGFAGVQGLSAQWVAMTAEDDVLITGSITSIASLLGTTLQPNGRVSDYAARFTVDGHLLWAAVLGPDGVEQDGGPIGVGSSGTVAITSTRRSDADDNGQPRIDALDPNGHYVWTTQAVSGSALADSVAVLADGTVVTGGFTAGFPVDFGAGTLTGCMYLAAHDDHGTLLDAVSYGTTCNSDIPWKLATGPSGALAFAGVLDQSIDFGTGALRFAGGTDAMIVMLDTAP